MHPTAARFLLAAITLAGIGWTVYARLKLTEEETTSWQLRKLFDECPQVGILIVLLTVQVMQDALPEHRWSVLIAFVAAYCLGHALWSF